MNRFSDFHPAGCIDSDSDVQSFYNTILSCTKIYRRASAYFSHGFYQYISKGLSKLLENNGQMKLLLSTEIDPVSYAEIKEGYELRNNKSDYILECISKGHIDLDNIDSSIVVYLIAIDKLDIKFVFKEEGLFHDKYAIFTDSFNDELILTGSGNETGASVYKNHESFDVTYTWDDSSQKELKKIADRKEKFERTWNNKIDDLIVLPMSEVIKERIIEKYLAKTIDVFKEYKPFIRIGINEKNSLCIQTNKDISLIQNHYLASSIQTLTISYTKNQCILMPNLQFRDIDAIISILKAIVKELDCRLVISDELNKIIENNYIDLASLAITGKKIKDIVSVNTDNEYADYSKNIQTLVKRPLKEKQILAAYHISKIKRAMNFSVPGSGKTASILGAYEYLRSDYNQEEQVNRILVLGPLNCFKAWKEEYSLVSPEYKLLTESVDVIDIRQMGSAGDKISVLKYGGFEKAKLILINFDIITSVSDVLSTLVDDKTMVVFDEIHRIKNYESEKKSSCLKIIQNTKYRVALTGTPLPNGYKDLFTMFNLLYGEYVFKYFGMSVDDLNRADKTFEEQGLESKTINDKIYPFYIRVSKKDLLVPKANQDHLIKIKVSEEEKKLYNKLLNSDKNSLEMIIKLTQVGCIPTRAEEIVTKSDINSFTSDNEDDLKKEYCDLTETSKIKALLKEIKANTCKSVIWCIYVETIEKITAILHNHGYKVSKIYGSTSLEERTEIINKFNNTNEIDFLITNPHTLAESVSLHKACHRAYYIELNYNLSQYLQSRDRIHRLGLEPGTHTDYFIFINQYDKDLSNSIDFAIYNRLKVKEKKMIEAIDEGNLIYKESLSEYDNEDLINSIKKGKNK